jgi:hypothetical protein
MKLLSAALVLLPSAALSQSFTTAAEVKPILMATKANWIAVRDYDGQDLLYFTNLLAWRCGVSHVFYAVNGGDPVELEMEPCHEDTAQPNALLMETALPYVTLPQGSVQTVTVGVVFDDDSNEAANFERKAVLIP